MTPEERAKETLKKFHRDCDCEHEERLIADAIRAAVAEEREACAEVADADGVIGHPRHDYWGQRVANDIAEKIRYRQ